DLCPGIVIHGGLIAQRTASSHGSRVVEHAKDQSCHPRGGCGNLFHMQDSSRRFNHNVELDPANLESGVLLDLSQQAVSKKHIGSALNLGQQNGINVCACSFHNFDHVTIEEF